MEFNFFLYVISGQKFRTDLKNLFGVKGMEQKVTNTCSSSDVDTKVSITASEGKLDTRKIRRVSEISSSV